MIVGAHGLRGEVRIRFFGDDAGGLAAMPELEIGSGVEDPDAERCRVLRVAPGRRGEARVALDGICDRDAAEAMRGRQVVGRAEHLEPLREGEYRWFELVGCRVEDTDGDPIGTVREIWATGAHDVLVVENEEGQRHLLPTAGEFVQEVDREGRRIVYQVIPGMLDSPC